MSKETCCVADQFCLAPANLIESALPNKLAQCFVCGEPVCVECSTRRKYLGYGRVRMCNDCQVEHDGNNKTVMRRTYRKAGYK